MTTEELEQVLLRRFDKIRDLLITKGKEYAPDGQDRLSNFNRAGARKEESREKALWGMAIKHELSVWDMIQDIDEGKLPSPEYADEKIGDLMTYLVLLEACIIDRLSHGSD